MCRIPMLDGRDLKTVLRNDGWYEVQRRGADHYQFKNLRRPGVLIDVSFGTKDLNKPKLNETYRKMGRSFDEIRALLRGPLRKTKK